MWISNSISWFWQAFETCDWETKRAFLKIIIVLFDTFLLVSCAYNTARYYYILNKISPFRVYSITWVSQLIRYINHQYYLIYFISIAWLFLISLLRWWAQKSSIVVWKNFVYKKRGSLSSISITFIICST